jgi:alanine-glyoxylate transaminase / serine-glyoxylate transaminase / serine-pyruvate transaminase
MPYRPGRHFLQIPGPTNVPDRILRAIEGATIDHRSTEFSELGKNCLKGLQPIFQTENPVVIYPSSATGAWEAALVNTLNANDRVLAFETGQFATLWAKIAVNLGLRLELIPGDWRHGVDAAQVEEKLMADGEHEIKAVLVVHNETSTGVTTDVPAVRQAIDNARHPALLMVDTVSSLGSIEYRHDEWRVDVTIAGSQKGLMLPPGLAFNAVGPRALEVSRNSKLPKSYWRWTEMLENNSGGFFPYTPATNLLFGLREAIAMLQEEGLANVFARHQRLAEATRHAVRAWGLEMVPLRPSEYSNSLTALLMPDGNDERALRRVILEKFNMSLGAGLGKLGGRAFRIGHLGDFNDLMLMGTLAGVEMGLQIAGVPCRPGGVCAALQYLTERAR